jgi:hypothetical protein
MDDMFAQGDLLIEKWLTFIPPVAFLNLTKVGLWYSRKGS